jgi:hypothetical protein
VPASSLTRPRALLGAGATLCAALALALPTASAHDGKGGRDKHGAGVQHVLLLSVDGMHQSDLDWYVAHHPGSALASLAGRGVEFTRAQTPVPSDSFPGMVGQVTGGDPSSTGVYYDDSFNRALLPAGTTSCPADAPRGAEVTYFEQLDKDQHALDAGQGLAGLPDNILQMTGDPRTVIDPTQLPVDPSTCAPVYPHSYLRDNTIFEVARQAGLRTAWSDKHPAYEILNGPSGTGIQDLFTPEINSDAPTAGSPQDWTQDNQLTKQYDGYKVSAILNEIDGLDHSGKAHVGTPAIFGMNFQTVSTAQKLPQSNGLQGGYTAPDTPGPLLQRALDFINAEVGAMLDAIHAQGLDSSTVVILSAKHGQSPDDPSALTRIDDGPILDGLNAAWKSAHPQATSPLVAFAIDDDAMLVWLTDRSPAAAKFAKDYLLDQSGTGNDINGNPKPYSHSGLEKVFAGKAAARYFHVSASDERVPDLFGVAQFGTVFTGKKSKIAEHGGANPEDRDVPLVVSGSPVERHRNEDKRVETTQIAPTILQLLGLDPNSLQAVRDEHTRVLPGT